jgi:ABC-2 type transport system ATP-binding protein
MSIVLETEALTRRFGPHTAVDALTLSVRDGEMFGLLGPNGTARVAGCDVVRHAGRVRRLIGYVPQALSVDGSLSGYENLLIFTKLYDIPRRERESRIAEALAFTGLADVAGRLVREYSGGMIRRLERSPPCTGRASSSSTSAPSAWIRWPARRCGTTSSGCEATMARRSS